jgi:hypothetical protein
MPRFFRFIVDQEELTNELFDYVTDPHPSRSERPVIEELHEVAPEMVDVLECMILDGVDQRRYVSDYVDFVVQHGPRAG